MKFLILLLLALLPGLSLASPPRSSFPSPDGRFEAVIDESGSFAIRALNGGKVLLQITNDDDLGSHVEFRYAIWGPDSAVLAAAADRFRYEETHLFLRTGKDAFEEIECPIPKEIDSYEYYWLLPSAWHLNHRLSLDVTFPIHRKATGEGYTGITLIQIDAAKKSAKVIRTDVVHHPEQPGWDDDGDPDLPPPDPRTPPTMDPYPGESYGNEPLSPPWLDAGDFPRELSVTVEPYIQPQETFMLLPPPPDDTEWIEVLMGSWSSNGFVLSQDKKALACDSRHGPWDHTITALVLTSDRRFHRYDSVNVTARTQISQSKKGRAIFSQASYRAYWSIDRVTTRSITLLTPVTLPSGHTPKILRCVLLLKPGGKAVLDSWDLHDP